MTRTDQRSAASAAWRGLYGTARWKAVRQAQLASEPLCCMCAAAIPSRVTRASVCDHVDPTAKETSEGFFDGPFMSLCGPHHNSSKQREERAGYSGACDVDGWPIDPRHPANKPVGRGR